MSLNMGPHQLQFEHRQNPPVEPSSNGQSALPISLGLQQVSNRQTAQTELLPKSTIVFNPGSQQLHSLTTRPAAHTEPMPRIPNSMSVNTGSQQLSIQQSVMHVNRGPQQFPMATKQASPMETSPKFPYGMPMNLMTWQQLSTIANKRSTQMEPSPKVMPINSGPKHPPITKKRTTYGEASRKVHNSFPVNFGPQPLPSSNKRPAPAEPSPKGGNELSEAVRAKLRESLTAALALVSEQQVKLPAEEKSSSSDHKQRQQPAVEKTSQNNQQQSDQPTEDKNSLICSASTPTQADVVMQSGESISSATETATSHLPDRTSGTLTFHDQDVDQKTSKGDLSGTLTSTNPDAAQKYREGEIFSSKILMAEDTSNSAKTWNCDGEDFELKHVLLDDEVSFSDNFFIKDELLQGNGLSWASELDVHLVEDQAAELFKLYSGVNKKYKEKGRSLLFNLKDSSNPELRERVMSGDIVPERLCSMTAEELASKELSEWRTAKAKEFAQMVILVDSEVDTRRLVKKTHKGEFQVEVERDDSASVEVALGSNLLTQMPPRANEIESRKKEGKISPKPNVIETSGGAAIEEKVSSQGHGVLGDVTELNNEKADYMQELMVDELKDAEDLPPIVSLDEFMEALDSEPPFENLNGEGEKVHAMPSSDEKNSDNFVSKLDHTGPDSKDPVDAATDCNTSIKVDKIDVKDGANSKFDADVKSPAKTASDVKPTVIDLKSGTCPPGDASIGAEPIWAGLIQLNVSVLVTVAGFFKSIFVAAKELFVYSANVQTFALDKEKEKAYFHDLKWTWNWCVGLTMLAVVILASGLDCEVASLFKSPSVGPVMQQSCFTQLKLVSHFCCGEKTPTKDWPGSIEIKGRVRKEAFEKFLQDLRLSRSRGIMVLQFFWKEESLASELTNLQETVESYIADERVGFAEPAPGIEIYFCPPHPQTTEMLERHLPEDQTEPIKGADKGLIGVVIWRKPTSHHRHSTKRQSSLKRQERNTTGVNASLPTSRPSQPPPSDDDDDDVPPGFGPAARRDDDDLPEFDFIRGSQVPASSTSHSRLHVPPSQARPVDQMRELVHRYGHGELGLSPITRPGATARPWNDDDDIPEWQPNQDHHQTQQAPPPPLPAPSPPPPLQPPMQHGYQMQAMNHHFMPMQPQQTMVPLPPPPPLPVPLQPVQQQTVHPTWHPSQWWSPIRGPADSGLVNPNHFGGGGGGGYNQTTIEGQYYGVPQNGMEWRPDINRGM
ncbi:hypothetical protein QJS04_geneDACA005534 [Acorus gramineus]|uniref:TFIIS central domain-containing protein n=1 Tax=Acorus gramineus TaxID=55184 RepID=A0AAV9A6G9_ACOGR|nr:hypothetical protein QJS04_geneDACA005534 [Acorus gramineus]